MKNQIFFQLKFQSKWKSKKKKKNDCIEKVKDQKEEEKNIRLIIKWVFGFGFSFIKFSN